VMYLSIFFLHLTLMAVFVVVPTSLEIEAGMALEQHAWVYLGALLFSVPGIYWLVQGRRYMNSPIANLTQCLGVLLLGVLLLSAGDWAPTLAGLCLFFTGFTALEAMLPSLASIYAPASARGTAMGVFASSQFIGVFVGGLMGGALLDTVGAVGVWAGIATLTLVWAVILGLSRLASPEMIAAR
jgi:predicted MFS family arabinose efflux permease